MARRIRDNSLESRTGRLKLKPRDTPYFCMVLPGVHTGYRRLNRKPGTFLARFAVGGGKYEREDLGTADDFDAATGTTVLDWWQAVDRTRARYAERQSAPAGEAAGPCNVDDALEHYYAGLEREGRTGAVKDARGKFATHVLPAFGGRDAGSITTQEFERWLDAIVKSPPRVRTKAGGKPRFRGADDSEDGRRRRRATAKRLWHSFKAALEQSFLAGRIASNAQWKRVKSFADVDGVRVDYLQLAEATRLMNACEPDFRTVVKAGLLTGARWSSLAALTVRDFNADAGTVTFRTRKGRGIVKTYHCHLTLEGIEFFKAACAGRNNSGAPVFLRADGEPWGTSEQLRRMKDAVTAAKIGRNITFHHLRHTWASHAVMNGTALLVVAQNLGHTDTRMVEKHYGHLAPGYRKQEILKGAPVFGIDAGSVHAL